MIAEVIKRILWKRVEVNGIYENAQKGHGEKK
jgi:hypothetical protein